jgi:RNA polymerase sigma-70 factor (ECF subfamily)
MLPVHPGYRPYRLPLRCRQPVKTRSRQHRALRIKKIFCRPFNWASIDRFNARDFDSVRDMLAEDVRLDLVNRLRLGGRSEVGRYFRGYAEASHWHCVPGLVDRRPAILMFDPNDPAGPPTYFILLEWTDERVVAIRDFLFARYAVEGADIVALG